MNEIEKNHQLIYLDVRNAMGLSMGLMIFGYKQFISTKRFEKLEIIKKLSEEFNPNQPPNINLISDLAFETLLDSIKITICFENFIKALLISNGFVIHKLDKTIFADLSKKQFTEPISVKQVLLVRDWEISPNIDVPQEWMKMQIKGIGKNTIGMKEMLSEGYLKPLGIPDKTIKLCTPYFQYRNNLHLYSGEFLSFTKSDYKDFVEIIEFINRDLVRIQNIIVDELKKGEQYKLPIIKYK